MNYQLASHPSHLRLKANLVEFIQIDLVLAVFGYFRFDLLLEHCHLPTALQTGPYHFLSSFYLLHNSLELRNNNSIQQRQQALSF